MPNRTLRRLNDVLRATEDINSFYQKKYLSTLTYCADIAPYAFKCSNMYYQLLGYDHFGSNEENEKNVFDTINQMVDAIGSVSGHITFSFLIDRERIGIFYGAGYQYASIVQNTLSKVLPNPNIVNNWIAPHVLARYQRYGSFIVGPKAIAPSRIDQVLSAMDGHQCMITIWAHPYSKNAIEDEISDINNIGEHLQKVECVENGYGGQRHRTVSSKNTDVEDTLTVINTVKERLLNGRQTALWETVVYVSAPLESELNFCAPIIASLFSSVSTEEHTAEMPTSIIRCSVPLIDGNQWNIPQVIRQGGQCYSRIYSKSLVNAFTSQELSVLLSPPRNEHRGYLVKHFGASANSISPFTSFTHHNNAEKKFEIGRLNSAEPLFVGLNDLRQHVLVTGETQFGKSTTVKRIICGARELGVPFVVLEAAKKDYWKLKLQPGMEGVRVFSCGDDGFPLRINPFQPENNTILEYHIQSLVTTMLSLFDHEDPLPQVLTELVYRAYEKLGWDTHKRIEGNEELRYPTFSALFADIDDCIAEIGYDEEIKKRMRGVLYIRLKKLLREAGHILNTDVNTSVETLYQTSAVLELDDIAKPSIPFLAGVIALKANEYARTQPIAPVLRRLLVVEEAHNILVNPDLPSTNKNQAACAAYFSNMLAEVSGYGTGMIVVDQRPSLLASGAIANTGLKISHHHSEKEDIKVISSAFSFNEALREKLRHLRVGQAIISMPNCPDTYLAAISQLPPPDSRKTVGCLFCTRSNCDLQSSLICEYDVNRVRANGLSGNVLFSCLNSIQERSLGVIGLNEKMCLAGYLCRQAGDDFSNSQIIRQQLYKLYSVLQKQEEAK